MNEEEMNSEEVSSNPEECPMDEDILSSSSDGPNPADFLEACLGDSPRSDPKDEESFDCMQFNSKSSEICHQEKSDHERWVCHICDNWFSSQGHLTLHSRVHKGESATSAKVLPSTSKEMKLYRCDLCRKSYSMAKHLWGHVSTAHRGNPLVTCGFCQRTFSSIANLANHKKSKHKLESNEDDEDSEESPKKMKIEKETGSDESDKENDFAMVGHEAMLPCELCVREFNDRPSLWLHILYSHKEEASRSCGICLKICDDFESLSEHVEKSHPRDKTEQRRYSCQICSRQHDSRPKLLKHAKIHHLVDEDGKVVEPDIMIVNNSEFYKVKTSSDVSNCQICFKSFDDESKLERHRSAHQSSYDNVPFVCEICGLSGLSRSESWKHMASQHSGDPNITCQVDVCGKVFSTSALKKGHETHHDLQGKYPCTCEICGKLWPGKTQFFKHVMAVHPQYLPFICGVCLKVFGDVAFLAKHVQELHMPLQGKNFCCTICGRAYSKSSRMIRHREIHYVSKPEIPAEQLERKLTCDLCDGEVEYEDFESLGKHRVQKHQVMPCDLCPKYYGRNSHLWKHVNNIHKGHPDITCSTCGITSASKSHLTSHMAKYHKKDIHSCEKCNKVFPEKALLKEHRKHCDAPSEGEYDCDRCSKSFSDPNLLCKHIRTSHMTYMCEICFTKVDSRTELYHHVRQNHSDHPDVKCCVCDKIFRTKLDLSRHQKDHHESYPQSHTCVFCAEILSSKIKLKHHMRKHHGKLTKCLCSICLKALPSFQDLKTHVEAFHKKALARPNVCPVCVKTCANKNKLMEHIKCHSKYFHPCKVCLGIFASKDDLNVHLKSHEDAQVGLKRKIDDTETSSAKKPKTEFPCDVCQATFIFMDDYLNHQESHKEPENVENSPKIRVCNDFIPIHCGVCGKIWPTNRHLWQHLIRYHSLQAATTCGICLKICENYIELSNHLVLEHSNFFDRDGTKLACRVCGRCHDSRAKLNSHCMIHVGHEERAKLSSHFCLLCQITFPLFKLFCEHNEEVHGLSESAEKVENSCDVCSLVFDTEQGLIDHKRTHTQEEDSEEMEEEEIEEWEEVEEENDSGTSGSEKSSDPAGNEGEVEESIVEEEEPRAIEESAEKVENSCDVCSLVFDTEQGLIDHKRTHTQEEDSEEMEEEEIEEWEEVEEESDSGTSGSEKSSNPAGNEGEVEESIVEEEEPRAIEESAEKVENSCDVCSLVFDTEQGLIDHKRTHTQEEDSEEMEEEEIEEWEEVEEESDSGTSGSEKSSNPAGNEGEVEESIVEEEEPRAIEVFVYEDLNLEVIKVDIPDEQKD